MHCEQCGAKLAENTKYCSSCGNVVSKAETGALLPTEYFSISIGRLMLFSVLTWGLYEIYWFYRNWAAVKKTELPNIWPVARGIFAIFFCHDLFKRVLQTAKSNGYAETYSAQWLATGYVVMLIVGNVWGRTESLGSLDLLIMVFMLGVTPLFLLPVQRAINFNNKKLGLAPAEATKFSGGEVVLIVLGCLFMTLSVWGILLPE
ncbi:zinc ribbon domain-containing protein [Candidatus Kaiserbacteria bacterium]|nr:zinc ribbon domain-containing protein [Candidatus Kaiserbacteria bacterium]